MSLKNSLYFSYNKKNSKTDFGIEILNVNLSSGLIEEPFLSQREILEKKIRKREKPYFQEVRRSPLEFTITIALGNNGERFTYDQIRKIASWLDQDFYKELYFSENPNRVYLAILNDVSNLYTNGLNQGYAELKFRCDSPYSYTPQQITQVYDNGIMDISELNTSSTIIRLSNHGLQTGDAIINKTINNTYRKVTFIDINNLQVESILGQTSGNIIYKYPASFITNPIVIDFINNGDLPVSPKVYITKIGDGEVFINDPSVSFGFEEGNKSSGILTFNDTVYDGETISIGNDIFEFSTTGTGTIGNLVDISMLATSASGTLSINGNVFEGDTVTIGEDTFEFTNDDSLISSINIPVNIYNYSNQATNILTFGSNPKHGTIVTIGNTSYTLVINTNNKYIYLSNHGLTENDLIVNTSIDSTIAGIRGLEIINNDCVKIKSVAGGFDYITNQVKGNNISTYRMNTINTNEYKISDVNDTRTILTVDSVNICNIGDIIEIINPLVVGDTFRFVTSVSLTNSNSEYFIIVNTAFLSDVKDKSLKVYNKKDTKIAENALAEGGYKVLIDNSDGFPQYNTIKNLMYAINNTANTIDIGTNEYNIKITGHQLNKSIPSTDYIINTRNNTVDGIRRIKVINENNFNIINPVYIHDNIVYPISNQTSSDTINIYRQDDKVSSRLSNNSTNTDIILNNINSLIVGDIIALSKDSSNTMEFRFITNISGNTITVNTPFDLITDIEVDINTIFVAGLHLLKTSIAEASAITIEANTIYSSDITKNTDVYALYGVVGLTNNQIKLSAIKPGYNANSIATSIQNTSSDNKFTYPSLTGGYDCSSINAKILLLNAISYNNIQKLNDTINYDKFNQYEVDTTFISSYQLKIKASIPGSKGNDIILSSNGKNMYWNGDMLASGGDSPIDYTIASLIDKINILTLSYTIAYVPTNKIVINYKTNGIDGNIAVTSKCINAYWNNITLTGGSDELLHGEEIFVDNENFIIQSSLENKYRTGIFNGNYLSLPVGVSRLNIFGNCTIQFIYYCKLRQG